MELWIFVVGFLAIYAAVIFLLMRHSKKVSADIRKEESAKREELRVALREAHLAFAAMQVTNAEAIDQLITAATHLVADSSMVSGRLVKSSGIYVNRHTKGLELVKEARATAGV